MLKDFLELISFVPLKNRFKLILIVFLMFSCAILEAFGIGILLPFLNVLFDDSFTEKYPFALEVFKFFNISTQQEIVFFFLAFILLIYLIKTILTALTYWVQYSFLIQFEIDLRFNLFEKYMMSPYKYFLTTNSSKIMRNIGAVIQVVDAFLIPFLIIITELLIIIAITFLLLYNAFNGGSFLIIFFVISVYSFQLLTKKKLKEWGNKLLKLSSKVIKNMHESIYGIKVIKILGREKYFTRNFKLLNSNTSTLKRNVLFVSQLPKLWLEFISVCALSLLMIILISQNPDVTHMISIIAIFVVAAFRVLPSANRILNSVQSIRTNTHARKLIIGELNKKYLSISNDLQKQITFKDNISLEDISFKYSNTENLIADRINLKIPKGSCIGFVGKSGAGKSTLIDILIGLLTPLNGVIKIDNEIIDASSRAWQKLIGYVSQSVYLTDDTIKNNIAFGIDDSKIHNEFIDYSVKASQLKDFVDTLPSGIDTYVGEHGVRLSGGQKQRIALARALYLNPQVLVLDEATSALDNSTEIDIMKSIKELKGDKTILIIAHRLSTLKYCDKVFELKNGKLVQT